MTQRLLLAAAVLLALLPGCLFDSCPYRADSIGMNARSTARFDVANATLAEQAWKDLGFDASRDGLTVRASQGDLEVNLQLDGNGTWMWIGEDLSGAEFRSQEAAQEYIDGRIAAASQQINATLQAFEAKVGWPPFVPDEPIRGSVSIC